jgi:hypothetical protein
MMITRAALLLLLAVLIAAAHAPVVHADDHFKNFVPPKLAPGQSQYAVSSDQKWFTRVGPYAVENLDRTKTRRRYKHRQVRSAMSL